MLNLKINKKEGLLLLRKLELPTVELISHEKLTSDDVRIKIGLSVRLSPKKNCSSCVGLQSIHNCTDYKEITDFIEQNKKNNDIIVHKSVKTDIVGSISKLLYRDSIILETYRNLEDRKNEIIGNRMVIPIIGGRLFISKLSMAKENKEDFKNFSKVVMLIKDIPFDEYDMEYVVEDGNVIFTDLTLPDTKTNNLFKRYITNDDFEI